MLIIRDIYLSGDRQSICIRIEDDEGDACTIDGEKCILEIYDLKNPQHKYVQISETPINRSCLTENCMAISLSCPVREERGIYKCCIIDRTGSEISKITKYIGEKIKINVEKQETVIENREGMIYKIKSDVDLAEDVIEYKIPGSANKSFKFLLGSKLRRGVPLLIFIASGSMVNFKINESVLDVSSEYFVISQ